MENEADGRKLLDVKGLSKYLSLPRSTIYSWVSLCKLPGIVRLGRALRFEKDAIDHWVSERAAVSQANAQG